MDLWLIFLTGLTIGGLTCVTLQGGLLASVIASRKEDELQKGVDSKHGLWSTLSFLVAKFIAYTFLGFVLGALGQKIAFSDQMRAFLQIFAGFYMIAVALNLLNLHPIFRYTVIQPPKVVFKFIKNRAKGRDIFVPALVGIFTILLPCGTTLAMEALAVSSGNPWRGALIMSAYTLGTVPLFFGLGALTTLLGDRLRDRFLKFASAAILYFAFTSINASLLILDSPLSFQSASDWLLAKDILKSVEQLKKESPVVKEVDGVQIAEVDVYPTSYKPNYFQVKSNTPIKLDLTTKGGLGCTQAFLIPKLGIREILSSSEPNIIEIAAQNPGKIRWTCSMGMYGGVLEVV